MRYIFIKENNVQFDKNGQIDTIDGKKVNLSNLANFGLTLKNQSNEETLADASFLGTLKTGFSSPSSWRFANDGSDADYYDVFIDVERQRAVIKH